MKEKTPSIAFDGINRVGKGTQIEKIKTVLADAGVEFVALRGDGTRYGLGLHDGDPLSPWWQEYSAHLRAGGMTSEWHYAAYELAKDIKVWKEQAHRLGKEIILLDRSLLSRATFVIDRESPIADILTIDHLYPTQPGPKITLEDVLPDVLFELVAPKEVVLARLDENDPKLRFRSQMIQKSYDIFAQAKERLPQIVRDRIVTIDSSRPIDQVFDSILEELDTRCRTHFRGIKK